MSDARSDRARRTKAGTSKKTRSTAKSAEANGQDHVCPETGCGKVCRSAAGLKSHQRQAHAAPPAEVESPTAAAERLLSAIEITPRVAVLAAQVRQLAKALEECELTDKAKTSKELTALLRDLLADAGGSGGEADWTEDEA